MQIIRLMFVEFQTREERAVIRSNGGFVKSVEVFAPLHPFHLLDLHSLSLEKDTNRKLAVCECEFRPIGS